MNIAFWMKKPEIIWTDDLPGWKGGVCEYEAFKSVIKIRPKYKNDIGIQNHEKKHAEQYKKLFWIHSGLYMLNASYRLKAELEAYGEQVKAYGYTRRSQYDWIVKALFYHYDLKMSIREIQAKADKVFDKCLQV